MSESLHDIAMKLGLLNDIGSFKQGEKLMKDFADAALTQQRRVKEAATDLSGTDKFLRDPAKNILKKSQIESLKQADLFALDDKLKQNILNRQEYNSALQNTVDRWTEITHAQQANLLILQNQQALQSINTEHSEDEIQRQKQLLELKQDINARTQEAIKREEQLANINSLKQRQNVDSLRSEREDSELGRTQELARLKQDILDRNRQQIIAEREISEELERQLLLEQRSAEIERDIILKRAERQEAQDKSLIGGLVGQFDTARLSAAPTAEKLSALREAEAKEINEIRKAAERSNISLEQMGKAIGVVQVKYAGMRNELDGTNTKLREHETLTKRTNALLGTYANMADRVAEDIETLTLALRRNIITQQQFDAATSVANQRLLAVRGSSGNLIYAIGELGRGLEDFITVMSITGFSTQGFGMAMRGASNNISQATMLMTGSSGALIGSFTGIAAIGIGQLIPYLFRTAKAVDEVTLAFERNSKAIDNTANAMSKMLDAKFKLEDISRIQSSSQAQNIFNETNPRAIEKARAEIEKLRQERITLDKRNIDSIITPNTSNIIQSSSAELQDVVAKYRTAIVSGNKEAIERSVIALQHHVDTYKFALMGLEAESKNTIITDGSTATAIEKIIKSGNALLNDKEKLNEVQKDITEATNRELTVKQQLADLEKQSLEAREKYFQLLEKEDLMRDNAAERDARILEQQSQFRLHKELDKDIRGNISEQSFLKDLSIRYRDLMAVPWMTEGSKEALDNSFRNELFTRESELERDLFLKQPDLAVGTSTVSEAVTGANRQIMEAKNDDQFTQQLNELKAIKKALEGNLFPVERIQ